MGRLLEGSHFGAALGLASQKKARGTWVTAPGTTVAAGIELFLGRRRGGWRRRTYGSLTRPTDSITEEMVVGPTKAQPRRF